MKTYVGYRTKAYQGNGYFYNFGNGHTYNSFRDPIMFGYGDGRYSVGTVGNGLWESYSTAVPGNGRGDGIGFYPETQMSIKI